MQRCSLHLLSASECHAICQSHCPPPEGTNNSYNAQSICSLTSTQHQNASLSGGFHSFIIHCPDVSHNVNHKSRAFVGVEVQHVAQGAICEAWAVHRYLVLVGPVVDAVWVVDLLAQAVDDLQSRQQSLALAPTVTDSQSRQNRSGYTLAPSASTTYLRPKQASASTSATSTGTTAATLCLPRGLAQRRGACRAYRCSRAGLPSCRPASRRRHLATHPFDVGDLAVSACSRSHLCCNNLAGGCWNLQPNPCTVAGTAEALVKYDYDS